jgi:tetratricopeptide (TPR) repeat protein
MSDQSLGLTPTKSGPSHTNPLREARELLEEAEALRRQQKFDRAEAICLKLLRQHPDYFGALHTVGLTVADKGDYRRAAEYLNRAAVVNAQSWMTLTALATVYLRLDAKEAAARALEQARAIKPNEPGILVTLGEIYCEEREYELARQVYREALALKPDMEEASIGLAQACEAMGNYREAYDALAPLIKRGGLPARALTVCLSLPESFIGQGMLPEIDKIARRTNENKSQFERDIAFARAVALDAAGRHDEAWQQTLAANRIVAPTMTKSLARHVTERETYLKWLQTRDIKAKPRGAGDGKEPITLLILGPSRSGKTTMETLVATLDGVKRGYENPGLEDAIMRTYQEAGLLTAYTLYHLPPQFYPEVRSYYAQEVENRAGSASVFTNTNPIYITECGHLAAIMPNVRFVFVKRNLDEVVWRIFQRNYNRGNYYAYDLKAIREHVLWFYNMIDVLAKKLPDITRVIQYEDMIADPALARKTVADLCGLAVGDVPLPPLGDDRGCSEPYKKFITDAV